jgi:transcriptional regulator with XRE-family HTH domain
MDAEGFGKVLSRLRERAGLTQQQLADRLGVDQASVSRWEREKGEPGVSQVALLASVLGVPVADLIPPAKPPRRRRKKK